MNAYELADKLDLEPYGIYGEQSANMLRQQADRIAELEQDLALKTRDRDVFSNFTLAYEKRIAELEKEKIRAYDNGYEDGRKQNTQLNTQLHPLSDEEINTLGHELIDVEYFDEGEYGMESNIYGLVEFARAIEERHGIK